MNIVEVDSFMGSRLFNLDILLALVIDDGFKSSIAYRRGHRLKLAYPLLYPCLDKTSTFTDKVVRVETQGHDRRHEETLKASSMGFWSTNDFQVGERVEIGIVRVKGSVRIYILPNHLGDIIKLRSTLELDCNVLIGRSGRGFWRCRN